MLAINSMIQNSLPLRNCNLQNQIQTCYYKSSDAFLLSTKNIVEQPEYVNFLNEPSYNEVSNLATKCAHIYTTTTSCEKTISKIYIDEQSILFLTTAIIYTIIFSALVYAGLFENTFTSKEDDSEDV